MDSTLRDIILKLKEIQANMLKEVILMPSVEAMLKDMVHSLVSMVMQKVMAVAVPDLIVKPMFLLMKAHMQ
jgi:hypothetical protein